jgi:hypothetical protein
LFEELLIRDQTSWAFAETICPALKEFSFLFEVGHYYQMDGDNCYNLQLIPVKRELKYVEFGKGDPSRPGVGDNLLKEESLSHWVIRPAESLQHLFQNDLTKDAARWQNIDFKGVSLLAQTLSSRTG